MRKKLAILLMLLIIFTSVNGVFAYTNLVEDGKITLNQDQADLNVRPSEGKYIEPTNSFTDNVINGYYLVTQDPTKVGLTSIKFNGVDYPIDGVLVGNDLNSLKVQGENQAIGNHDSKNNRTFFFDTGTYIQSDYTRYTGLSRENVSYVGLFEDKVIFTKAPYPLNYSVEAARDCIERYNWSHKNIYIENIIFDGGGKDLLPLGGSHYQYGDSGIGKNRGEYMFFITGNGDPFNNTDGFVAKNVTIQNVGATTLQPHASAIAHPLTRKNVAINIFESRGNHYFENILIKNIKTKEGYGVVSTNNSKGIYFKNLTIDTSDVFKDPGDPSKNALAVKVERLGTQANEMKDNSIVIEGLTTPDTNPSEAVFVQNSTMNSVFLPENYRWAVYRNTTGMVFETLELANGQYRSGYSMYDRKDNMWVIREDIRNINGQIVSVQEQINDILRNFYVANISSNDYTNVPTPKIKLVVKDGDIDGFNIQSYNNIRIPVEIVAVKSIDDDVTRTGESVQIPVKGGATFNFALANANTILYNFDFDTNAKYTYQQAANGVNGTATLSDPNQVNTNIAGYPVYNTYFTGTQGAKITSARSLTTANFQNNRFTDLAFSLTATSSVNNIFVNGNATVSGEIKTFYTGVGIVAKGLGTTPDKTINYYSSDPTIATVDPTTGVVTGVSKGTVTIYAKSMDTNNEGEIEKPWAVVEINVVNKVTFKLDDTKRINFEDDTTNPKESAAGTDGSIAVPNTKLLTSQTGTNILEGWIADVDVKIDNEVIPAGTLITPDKIGNVIVSEDTEFTSRTKTVPYLKADFNLVTGVKYPDTGNTTKSVLADKEGKLPAAPSVEVVVSTAGTYTFKGWIADKDIELTDGTVINAGDLILEEQVENSKITENTIFTAVVEFKGNVEVTKTVTFNKNTTQYGDTTNQTHAIVTLSENEMTVGRKMPINPTYTSEGKKYEFLGWNTRSDGSGTNFTDSTLVPESITVYAIWKVTIIPIDDKDDKPINPGISDLLLWGGGDIRPSGRLKHMAYIIGYPDGTVRPIGDITRAEVATIFFRLLDDNVRDGNLTKVNNYSDVEPTKWYNTAISTLTKLNVIKGYEDGSFKPDGKITRAELATMVTRFRQVNGHSAVMSSFQDVGDNWAARFIDIAYENQWIAGYEDGSFRPDREITRAEMATIVNRMLERGVEITQMLENMRRFSDNLPGTWYYEEIQEAANSHTYDRTGKKVPVGNYNYEIWVELIPDRDWTEYER